MKKFVFVSVFVLFGCLNAFCAIGEFTVDEYPYMQFTVIDEANHTVSVKGYGAHANITGELTIPGSVSYGGNTYTVTEIAEYGFNKVSISKLVIEEGVEIIGMGAFRDITTSFTVELSEGLKVICNRAFCASTGLNGTIVFPTTLERLGGSSSEEANENTGYVFHNCVRLSRIEFTRPEPIFIAKSNFTLTTIYVPKESISDYSNANPSFRFVDRNEEVKETSIFVPHEGSSTDGYIYDIFDLDEKETEDKARVVGFVGTVPRHITFPDTVVINKTKRAVAFVKQNAFGYTVTDGIETITFPKTMKAIGTAAFRSITSSFTVEFNDGLEKIGNRAFCESTGLIGTTSRATVQANGKVGSVLVIPSTVNRIEGHAFYNCTSITDSVVMEPETPPTVPAGEGVLFGNVPAVVRIPCNSVSAYKAENINYWSTRTLYDPCDDDIVLGPNFMYRIIDKEKRHLSLLGRRIVCDAAVTVPSSLIPEGKDDVYYVKKIAARAFNSSNLLTSLTISAGVDTIESNAFLQNKSLKQVTVAAKVIGENAFYECSALQELILEEGVETIKERAFVRCDSLTEITFPETIKEIADYAFFGSKNIKEVEFLGENPPKLGGDNILIQGEGTTLERIWVPCGLYHTYDTTNHGPGRWLKLRSYLRSRCPALELGEDENITSDMTVSTIALRRTFNIGEWTPLYFPFAVDSVLVVNKNAKRININQPWTIENGGYFYLETLKDIDTKSSTLSFELADAIQPQTPYLIQFQTDYFGGKDVIFKSKEGEYTLQASKQGNLTCTTEYTTKGNEGYVNEDVSTGYFLNYDQNNNIYHLYLKENSSLSPFDFVLLPPQEVSGTPSKAPRRFSMRTSSMGNISGSDITTSLTTVSDTEPIRYTRDGEQVTLYPAGKALQVYSIDGMLLYSVEAGTDVVSMHLSAGMYILYCNGNSQKMLL